MEKGSSNIVGLLPDTVEGWKIGRRDREYDHTNLYDYLNGGAELYLSYGFQGLINRTYTQPGQPEIFVDIFDMGNSRNAFGVFSHSRESIEAAYGQGSQYYGGSLVFWKDAYFVSLLASPETAESKKALPKIATYIDSAIAKEGPLPGILALLPAQDLVEESIRYFRHHIWLNAHYFVAEENIFHINEKTDALLAKYGQPEQRYFLLVVQYERDEDARTAHDNFVKEYLPERMHKVAVQLEDGSWTASRLSGRLLMVVFSAPSEETALGLLEAVQNKSRSL